MNRISLALGLLILTAQATWAVTEAVVIWPVVDVWNTPPVDPSTMKDDQRETQLLFGERVKIIESRGKSARIEAVGQPEYTHHSKWEGYPGWVETQALKVGSPVRDAIAVIVSTWTSTMQPEMAPDVWLSFGSLVRPSGQTRDVFVVGTALGDRCVTIDTTRALPQTPKPIYREGLLHSARQLIGVPYLWGGLTAGVSPQQPLAGPQIKYGLDCSGFVHLMFRIYGFITPRDAHDQWMKATPIKRADLLPADLIFSAKADKPKKITHVAFYAGDNQIIEAPQTGLNVRQISFQEKYGAELNAVESGKKVEDRVIYFGRFIKD